MTAFINPAALPALRIPGALFLIINLLAAAWAWRHRRQLFGRIRLLPAISRRLASYRRSCSAFRGCFLRFVCSLYGSEPGSTKRLMDENIPWLVITTVLIVEWVRLWFN